MLERLNNLIKPLALVALVVGLLVAGGGAYYLSQKTLTPQGSQLPSPVVATSSPVRLAADGEYWQVPSVLEWGAYTACDGSINQSNSRFMIDYGDGTSGAMKFGGRSLSVENTTCLEYWVAPEHTYTTQGNYSVMLYRNGEKVETLDVFIGRPAVQWPGAPRLL